MKFIYRDTVLKKILDEANKARCQNRVVESVILTESEFAEVEEYIYNTVTFATGPVPPTIPSKTIDVPIQGSRGYDSYRLRSRGAIDGVDIYVAPSHVVLK